VRRWITTATVLFTLTVVASPAASDNIAEKQLVAAREQVQIHRKATWTCQGKLGRQRTRTVYAERHTNGLSYVRWVKRLWAKRRHACEKRLGYMTLPRTNDWRQAVRIVQRVYPGTADWMLYISHREGGYGPWVWYGGRHWAGYHIGNDFLGADTVGGWMQFRFSTFAPYWKKARVDVRRRGFIVPDFRDRGGPDRYQAWLSPLGQALTAGYMRYTGQDGCHWCL
jgi:hypothetical protein